MGNIKFFKNPGFVFDLFFLFTVYFNREDCLTRFINYNKSSEDTDYYNNVLNEFLPISDELLLFFHLTEDKKCLMTQSYYEPYLEQFISDGYDISVVQDALGDHEHVIDNVIRYYFKDIGEEAVQQCKTSLPFVGMLIKNSGYSGEIKSALYSFFIEPYLVIRKLSYELMEKGFLLAQKYDESYEKLHFLMRTFDLGFVTNGFEDLNIQKTDISYFEEIGISFCLRHKNCVKTHYFDNRALVLLGSNYVDCFKYLAIQKQVPELESFGNAVSEPNRVAILDLMLQQGEVTIKDLEQEFGLTGTNAYYHLSLMIKAGMVKTRNRGRTVLYSINKTYFQTLCDVLGKYHRE